MKIASWVIVEKATSAAVFETFNKSTADKINTTKYQAVPILKYLSSLNNEKSHRG